MAWRYKQHKPASGDSIVPSDWELNHQEMASEYNGYLDRDNFREEIFSTLRSDSDNAPLVALKSFNDFFQSQFNSDGGNSFTTFDNSASGWTYKGYADATGSYQEYAVINCDLPLESLLICEFSCGFQWNPVSKLIGSDHRWLPEYQNGDKTGLAIEDSDDAGKGSDGNEMHATIEVAATADPLDNGYGWFQTNPAIIGGTDAANYDGAASYESDVYQETDMLDQDTSFSIEAREAFLVGPPALYGACSFRVTVDGITVCESGWFSDHRENESVYLVGAIPVSPGPHVVLVETRKGFVSNDKPNMFVGSLKKPVVMYDRELIVHARYR